MFGSAVDYPVFGPIFGAIFGDTEKEHFPLAGEETVAESSYNLH